MLRESKNNRLTPVNVYGTVYTMFTNDESDARPDDGQCRDCGETIVKGCSVFVYGDRLCMDCGSDRKVR